MKNNHRSSTGIPALDDILHGGLIPEQVALMQFRGVLTGVPTEAGGAGGVMAPQQNLGASSQ
jgi:hypothetical protein